MAPSLTRALVLVGAAIASPLASGGTTDVARQVSEQCGEGMLGSDVLGLVARYDAFRARFGRPRAATWDCQRLRAFAQNEALAAELNAEPEDDAEYSAEHSPFGDMTQEEFAQQVLMRDLGVPGAVAPAPAQQQQMQQQSARKLAPAREAWDWTEHKGVVSPVRDQGTLGTCYVFSAAGSVEGQLAIKHGVRNVTLSVEQSLECNAMADEDSLNAVCGEFGGWPYLVFEFWKRAGGAVAEAQWPYCAGQLDKEKMPLCFPCMPSGYSRASCGEHDDFFCNATSTAGARRCRDAGWVRAHRAAAVAGWKKYPTDEDALASALAQDGPLSATMDATMLQLYRRGVANPWLCSSKRFNHSVLLVGFGHDKSKPFWRAKASWGAAWGEAGYFRMVRGKEKCGINRAVVGATIE